jgi:hypothetical protein
MIRVSSVSKPSGAFIRFLNDLPRALGVGSNDPAVSLRPGPVI